MERHFLSCLLVPYLVWEINRGKARGHRGSRGSKSAATAISDLMWAAFLTRNQVETKRRARGGRPGEAGHTDASYRNGSGALCSLLVASNHVWNSSAVWTVTNPRIRAWPRPQS